MKILFCIKTLNAPGGAERILTEVASGMAERGHEVGLLSFDDMGGQTFYPLHTSVKRVCPGSGAENALPKSLRMMRHVLMLRRIVPRLEPDVAVGFMHSMFIPLGLALWKTRFPVIASEHIGLEHYRGKPLQKALMRLTPLYVKKITCVSEQVRQAFPAFSQKKMVVVPNPVAMEVRKKSDPVGDHKPMKTLLSVGHLVKHKDHNVLIEAFAQLAADFPSWTLRIVGDGELRGRLRTQATVLGLDHRVRFVGTTKEINREYEDAQLYVHSAHYESHGLTVVEALMHGLPSVGFENCMSVNTLIRHGRNGLLANGDGDRATALAECLRAVMSDAALRIRLSEHGGGLPEENRIEHVLDRWETLLRAVAGSRPKHVHDETDL